MSLKINEAEALFEQGKQDRRNKVVDTTHPLGSSEHYWWAKGWLEEHEAENEKV